MHRYGKPAGLSLPDLQMGCRASRLPYRLGHEAHGDLTPLCRACHREVHRVLESDRSWRRLDRAQATDLIVAALRHRALTSKRGAHP